MSLGCDDNRKGLCQAGGGRVRGRGWSAGWGGAHKGGAAAVYKMLITPTTKALVGILETAPQSW